MTTARRKPSAMLITFTATYVCLAALATCSPSPEPGRNIGTNYYYSTGKKNSQKSSEDYEDDYYYDDSSSREQRGRSRAIDNPSSVGAAIWEFLGESLRNGQRGGTTNVNYAPKFGPTFNKIVINKEGAEVADDEKTAQGDNLDNPDGVEVPARVKPKAKSTKKKS